MIDFRDIGRLEWNSEFVGLLDATSGEVTNHIVINQLFWERQENRCRMNLAAGVALLW